MECIIPYLAAEIHGCVARSVHGSDGHDQIMIDHGTARLNSIIIDHSPADSFLCATLKSTFHVRIPNSSLQ